MLTPEEARALVEQHGGNVSAAARAAGVPRPTFTYWLDPETERARSRDRYHANPEPKKAQMLAHYHENADAEREKSRQRWDNLSGPAYSRRLLQMRRQHGLRRMAERNKRPD